MPDFLKPVLIPIHRAGWPFIAVFVVSTAILWAIWTPLGVLGLILTIWCVFFFRDPSRVTPFRAGLVIAPADGVVVSIDRATPPAELGMPATEFTRICTFMNVFNVHVNRAPIDGEVLAVGYRPGKFFNASLDKASEENERLSLRLRTDDNRELVVVQIAGLVARRIVCHLKLGDRVRAGTRFGMIRFGSRVDVYIPKEIVPQVIEGQTMIAGETVLADFHSNEPSREGGMR